MIDLTKTPKFNWITPSGYEFKYLSVDPNNDPQLKDLLNESTKYTKCYSLKIFKDHFKHLEKQIGLQKVDQYGSYHYYIDLAQGYISILKEDDLVTLLLWVEDTEDPNEINATLLKKLSRTSSTIVKQGLNKFIDPNFGGKLSKDAIEIAELIIYG